MAEPLAVETNEVLPLVLVAFITGTVPTDINALPSFNVKLEELVPPVKDALVALIIKPCPTVDPTVLLTLFSNVTVLPVALIVNPAVFPALVAPPVKATELLAFNVKP